MRPAVAEVVKVLERFRADIFDCRQQRDLARIERAISPVLISQTKADVADTELVKVAVGPAHRRLQHLVKTMELDAERHHNAPHHRRFDVVKGDLQPDQGGRHL